MESSECTMELHEVADAAEKACESPQPGKDEDEAVEDDGDDEYEDVPDEPPRAWPCPVNRRFRLRPRKRTEPCYEGKLKRIVRTTFKKKSVRREKKLEFLLSRERNVVVVRNTRFSSFVRKTRRKEIAARALKIMQNRRNMQEVEIKLWQLNL